MPITKARLKISDYNEKRKKALRQSERRVMAASLSLTSMVDMFAILVIYLLTSASTVTHWIELGHSIELPKAHPADAPKKAATLMISRDGVFGGGDGGSVQLASLESVSSGPFVIAAIRNYLGQESRESKKSGYVNLVADKSVSYGAIKRLIATCQDAGFGNVNLAVQPMAVHRE